MQGLTGSGGGLCVFASAPGEVAGNWWLEAFAVVSPPVGSSNRGAGMDYFRPKESLIADRRSRCPESNRTSHLPVTTTTHWQHPIHHGTRLWLFASRVFSCFVIAQPSPKNYFGSLVAFRIRFMSNSKNESHRAMHRDNPSARFSTISQAAEIKFSFLNTPFFLPSFPSLITFVGQSLCIMLP